MKITHIICTRNLAEQLSATLAKFNTSLMVAHQIEFVLVDSESTDDTPQVMSDFAAMCCKTRIVRAGKEVPQAPDAGQPGAETPSPKRAQGAKA